MTGRDVLLAFPHPGSVSTGFMTAVLSATTAADSRIAAVTDLRTGPILAQARTQVALRFLDSGLDWLWMCDADMVFSDHTLPALLDWADPDKVPVLGAACRALGRDGQVIVTAYKAGTEPRTGQYGLTSLTTPELPPDSLIQVDATGAACLLVHRSVFPRLDSNWPGPPGLWFAEQTLDGRIFGEDLSFCLRCADAGVSVHVHTGIQVAHMRSMQLGEVSP